MKCAGCNGKILEYPKQISPLCYIHDNEKCRQLCIDKHVKKIKKENEKNKKKAQKITTTKNSLCLTQDVVNRYIRTRDANKDGIAYCISCNHPIKLGTKSYHAGHFHTVGARSDLRFNPDNIHGQCSQCNKFNNCRASGSVGENYRKNLIKKIGHKRVDALNTRTKQDYSEKALKEIRRYYAKKTREMLSDAQN